MDDDLRQVRTLLDKPPPADAVVHAGRDRLAAAARRRSRRPVWMAAGLTLTAATAATAVAVATLGGPAGDVRRPDVTASGPAGDGPGPDATATPLDARTVLLAAATKADEQADQAGTYWHSVMLRRDHVRATSSAGEYIAVDERRDEIWTPNRPGLDQWMRRQNLGIRPATPADEAIYKRAGSPATITFPRGLPIPAGPRKPDISRNKVTEKDATVFWIGRSVSMKDLRELPTDPKRLKASLLRSYKGHGTESSGTPMDSDLWLFTVAKDLVTHMPVTPQVRGAAFRMLAGLPRVRAVGTVKDAQGRTGTAIGLTEKSEMGGVLQYRLIVDATGGRALGEDAVVLRPGRSTAGLPRGSLWFSVTVVTLEWTHSPPR
ncbi:CU044_5270 family protein [Actinomadura viridis]|uniref:CU044_5270 family protein n=1 Tax=Actinomadura viridis TaxID=58110 RepID=UPI0036B1B81F